MNEDYDLETLLEDLDDFFKNGRKEEEVSDLSRLRVLVSKLFMISVASARRVIELDEELTKIKSQLNNR